MTQEEKEQKYESSDPIPVIPVGSDPESKRHTPLTSHPLKKEDEGVPPLFGQSNSNSEYPSPPTSTTLVLYPTLRAKLQDAYRDRSTLPMPLSQRSFPIQAVSLTINAKSLHASKEQEFTAPMDQKEKKREKKDKISERRIRLEFGQERLAREERWHQIEKPILIEDIFKPITPEKSGRTSTESEDKKVISSITTRSNSVHRILIEGRAGVGKTTLVQFTAWQWATQGLFNRDYDYLLWVPLRQWLSGNSSVTTTLAEDLAAFLHTRYFKAETTTTRLNELEAILGKDSSRTLLVLDGYDEVAHHLDRPDSVYGQLLRQALKFKNLIVTTRDYQRPPADIAFDSTLVNIGFTNTQIEDYVTQYLIWQDTPEQSESKLTSPLKEKKSHAEADPSLTQALRGNSQLWALAHIPLNLTLICETQGRASPSIKTPSLVLSELTLTTLYQKVLQGFLLRQLKKQGEAPKLYDLQTLKSHFIVEWDSLSTLAWEGFIQGEVVLSPQTQENLLVSLRKRYPRQKHLEHFLERSLQLGLLRSEDPDNHNLLDQPRYFIHLTFQEYLAAQYVVDTLQGYRGEESYQHTLTWLARHKYDPHTAVVMGFIAGISVQPGYDQALATFWSTILSPPHDLTGRLHLRLMLRCLEEARYDRRIPDRPQLIQEIEQWGRLLLRREQSHSEALMGLLSQYPQVWKQTPLMDLLLTATSDKDGNIRKAPIQALGNMGERLAAHPEILALVHKATSDKNGSVRKAAIEALGNMGEQLAAHPESVALVLKATSDKDWNVRSAAIQALGKMGERLAKHPESMALVLKAAGDKNWDVQRAAIEALGKMGEQLAAHSESWALVQKAAGDEDRNVRSAAIEALGKMGEQLVAHSESWALVQKAAGDKDWNVRWAAIWPLSNMGERLVAHPESMALVLKATGDEDRNVRMAAIYALGKIGEQLAAHPKSVALVLKAAGDEDGNVRMAAIDALGKMGEQLAAHPKSVAQVHKAAGDEDRNVRSAAIYALGKIGEQLAAHPKSVALVLKAVGDKNSDVRSAAIGALGNMGERLAAYPESWALVLKAAGDKDWDVRMAAIRALGKLGERLAEHPESMKLVHQAAGGKEGNVRWAAIKALGNMGERLAAYPESMALVLKAAGDEDRNVRMAAIDALGKMSEQLAAHPESLARVLKAAGDKDWDVRMAAIRALGKLGERLAEHPESMKLVHQAAGGKEGNVRWAAIKALGNMGERLAAYPESMALVLKAAGDEDRNVRMAAIDALGKMSEQLAAHPESLARVLKATSDGNWGVWEPARAILHAHWACYIQSAIRYYLSTESTSTLGGWITKKLWTENPWLLITVNVVSMDLVPFSAGLVMDNHTLQILSGHETETLALPSPVGTIKPLIEAITQAYAPYGLALPDYAACVGEKPFYPHAKRPPFRASTWSEPRQLPRDSRSSHSVLPRESGSQIPWGTDSKLSHNQQLRQSLKKLVPETGPVRVFISYAWEAWGSTQLAFLQSRFLHDTLAQDLRRAGLAPWLDTRQMTGDMDRQMVENIAHSDYTVLIGTQLYAERSKLLECQLVRLASFTENTLPTLPLTTNIGYIRTGDQLFYVADKAKGQVLWLQHLTANELQAFDRITECHTLPWDVPRTLSKTLLSQITLATCHSRTNVRKELEFILTRAKQLETPRDFLLPLLIEGEFNQTFGDLNETNQKFLLYDCKSWFSVKEANWKSYQSYIFTLTQTLPYLGILPCLLGLSATERSGLRAHYELLADRLRLALEQLAQKQPKTMNTEQERNLQASLYFKDQQTLLHNFLRQVAALTRQNTQEILPVETPITTMASSPNQGSSSSNSSNSSSSSSTSTSVTSSSSVSSTTQPSSSATHSSSTLPSVPVSSFSFFQSHKPAVIKNEAPAELKRCMENFQKLFKEHNYTFVVNRTQINQLVIQFTAQKNVAEDPGEIQEQLQSAATKLKQLAHASGLAMTPNQFKLDWKTWTLTIDADSANIHGLTWLLQTASTQYMKVNEHSSTQEINCLVQ